MSSPSIASSCFSCSCSCSSCSSSFLLSHHLCRSNSKTLFPRRSSRHPNLRPHPRLIPHGGPAPEVRRRRRQTVGGLSSTSVVFRDACRDSAYAGHHLLCPLLYILEYYYYSYKTCGLWTLSCDFVPHNYETLKWLSSLPILMQKSFWW